MKVADTVLRYFTNLRQSGSSSSASPTPTDTKGKAKKPPPIKAQIGLQNYALAHPTSDSTGETTATYFYCLPSTSGRVAAYPVRSPPPLAPQTATPDRGDARSTPSKCNSTRLSA